ncbi:MAG TPA: RNA polymerase factor sigma-54 [Rhodospirillales bacterium]|nr:RNA polymerase factor sigma-54 [Rhodospirillales bacterium]
MALTPRLDLRQTQSLVMTPQLQQAIKLLQFSSLELAEYVETQLEQNPLLEREEFGDAPENGVELATADAVPLPMDGEPISVDSAVDGSYAEDFLDVEFSDNLFDADPSDDSGFASSAALGAAGWQGKGGSFDDHEASTDDIAGGGQSLREHLAGQLAMAFNDPVDKIIGAHLIDMLDEAGYLIGDTGQIAELLGTAPERIQTVLERLQQFEPTGVFARSLAECLHLQLEERGWLDDAMLILLRHLDAVGRRDWSALMRLCGVDGERLQRMVALIRSLNPKPALAFDYAIAQPMIPDVTMRQQPGGGWVVELNSETLPRVLVNNQYYARVSRNVSRREEKQYVNECLQSAKWLVKSLHQRATTILKVATQIVRQQQEFFVSGVESLKPMVLRDIADAIGMHESTVSRVTSNKFMATPRGIFELKYFFTHAVGGSAGGDAHSAESVRWRIRKMIDAEPANAVLSDDALADALQKEGIDIARRTVAKYREAMRIPSSMHRRREKGDTV